MTTCNGPERLRVRRGQTSAVSAGEAEAGEEPLTMRLSLQFEEVLEQRVRLVPAQLVDSRDEGLVDEQALQSCSRVCPV